MIIGVLPDPESHPLWDKVKTMLEPAARRGGVPIIEPHELVWVVYDNGPIGAATARLTEDGFGEIVLVGGTDYRRWIAELDNCIGQAMKANGMRAVRAYGRKGWVRVLKNWAVIGQDGEAMGYERVLQ